MANYYVTARSNYFRVKDTEAFETWCNERNLNFWTKEFPNVGRRYAISPSASDPGGWPYYDGETDKDIDLCAELARHLDARDVAVLIEVGSEKLRYLIGEALAVYHDGRTVGVHLDEIYERAADEFSGNYTITEATY
jgi:hypothetical protein